MVGGKKESPKPAGRTGPSNVSRGGKELCVDIDDIGTNSASAGQNSSDLRRAEEEPTAREPMRSSPLASWPSSPPSQRARFSAAESQPVPEYMKKVEEYITDHFYPLEARLNVIERKIEEVVKQLSQRDNQVADVFVSTKQLIELQYTETQKGLGRDLEMEKIAESFKALQGDFLIKQSTRIDDMEKSLHDFHNELKEHADKLMDDFQGKLRMRDDASYRFEAELMSIKTSFSSLRLEFQKQRKGQDFKNTSSSVFLLKAIDMKPDERKKALRTLTEQEEKHRGALVKAETDLRDEDKKTHAQL